jgi:hypothetical protein
MRKERLSAKKQSQAWWSLVKVILIYYSVLCWSGRHGRVEQTGLSCTATPCPPAHLCWVASQVHLTLLHTVFLKQTTVACLESSV